MQASNKMPTGWVKVILGDLVHPSNIRIDPTTLDKMAYIGLEHIESNTGHLLGYGYASEVRSTKSVFSKGDLLYGKLRPYLNKVYLASIDGICSTDILVFSKSQYLDYQYLAYQFLTDSFVAYANSNSTGVQHPRVKFDALSKFEVPLPPLNEQRRIVAKIDQLTTHSRRARQALDDLPTLIDQFRQSVLAAAFRGDLTADWRKQNPDVEPAEQLLERIRADIANGTQKKQAQRKPITDYADSITATRLPEEWKLTQLGLMCLNSFYGPRFSKNEYTTDGIPSIRTTDMSGFGAIEITDDTPRIKIPSNKLDLYKVIKNDLLITRSGSVGVMAIFKYDYIAIPSAYLIRFRFTKLMSIDYIFLYLQSPIGQQLLGLSSTAVTQPNINAEAIKSLPIPLCSQKEQAEVVKRVYKLLAAIERLNHQYEDGTSALERLDASILAKAFRGELVPQDPNDEPASLLLERIRRQRQTQPKPSQKRRKTQNP